MEIAAIHWFVTLLIAQVKTGFFTWTTHTGLGRDTNAVGMLVNLMEEAMVAISNHC
jgi:hypothetical protein